MKIFSRWDSKKVLYESKKETMKEAVVEAVERGAYLRNAYLRNADLRGADLRGADLRGADLWGADLRDADLRNAKITITQKEEIIRCLGLEIVGDKVE